MKGKATHLDVHHMSMWRGSHSIVTYAHIDDLVSHGCRRTDEWGETPEGVSNYEKSAKYLQAALIDHARRVQLDPLMGGVLTLTGSASEAERVRGVVEFFDLAYDLLCSLDLVVSPVAGDACIAVSMLCSAIGRLEYAMNAPPGFEPRMAHLDDPGEPYKRPTYQKRKRMA